MNQQQQSYQLVTHTTILKILTQPQQPQPQPQHQAQAQPVKQAPITIIQLFQIDSELEHCRVYQGFCHFVGPMGMFQTVAHFGQFLSAGSYTLTTMTMASSNNYTDMEQEQPSQHKILAIQFKIQANQYLYNRVINIRMKQGKIDQKKNIEICNKIIKKQLSQYRKKQNLNLNATSSIKQQTDICISASYNKQKQKQKQNKRTKNLQMSQEKNEKDTKDKDKDKNRNKKLYNKHQFDSEPTNKKKEQSLQKKQKYQNYKNQQKIKQIRQSQGKAPILLHDRMQKYNQQLQNLRHPQIPKKKTSLPNTNRKTTGTFSLLQGEPFPRNAQLHKSAIRPSNPQKQKQSQEKLSQCSQKCRRYIGDDQYQVEFINGGVYRGPIKNNMFHGKGVYQTESYRFEGVWKFGEPDGPGVTYLATGAVESGYYMKRYKRFGLGEDKYANGESYVGNFQNQKKNGHGTYYFFNGDYYVGQWKNDQQHGKGVQHFTNGSRYQGVWKDDERHGQGTFYNKEGKVRQIWDKGVLMSQVITLTSDDE